MRPSDSRRSDRGNLQSRSACRTSPKRRCSPCLSAAARRGRRFGCTHRRSPWPIGRPSTHRGPGSAATAACPRAAWRTARRATIRCSRPPPPLRRSDRIRSRERWWGLRGPRHRCRRIPPGPGPGLPMRSTRRPRAFMSLLFTSLSVLVLPAGRRPASHREHFQGGVSWVAASTIARATAMCGQHTRMPIFVVTDTTARVVLSMGPPPGPSRGRRRPVRDWAAR